MTHSVEGKWIEEVTDPYKKVVDGTNTPPLPLESLAKAVAKDPDGLKRIYKQLIEAEEKIKDPPFGVNKEEAQVLFDSHPSQDRKLTPTEQKEKWIDYPKLRVIAAWKKMEGNLPGVDEISGDWGWGIPEEEVNLIMLMDTHAQLDSQSPENLSKELRRQDNLKQFLEDVYQDNRNLRRKIMDLDRPGVSYGLLEAYEERINILNDVYITEIQDSGVDSLHDRLSAAEQDVRATRDDVEADIRNALNAEIEPRLSRIESTLMEFENQDETGDVAGVVDQRLWELRQDLQEWSVMEASDLETELAKFTELRREMRRTFFDERIQQSEALLKIGEEINELNSQVSDLAEAVDDDIREVYDRVGGVLTGEDYDNDRPVLEELSQLLWLYAQLQDDVDDEFNQ